MAHKQGRLSSVAFSTDGGTTYNALLSLVDATLNIEKSEIDTSDRGDGAWSSFLQGRKSATIDLKANWDVADAVLMTLLDACCNDTELSVRFRPDTLAGEKSFVANCFVKSFPLDEPGEDKATVDVSIRINGSITLSTQS